MTAQQHVDILICVEDPGAANFVAPLVPVLQDADYVIRVIAAAAGAEQLDRFGVPHERVDGMTDAEAMLNEHPPHLVLIGTSENPDTLGLKLIAAARQLAVPSVGVVDGPANADWRFRGRGVSALAFAPDWILVADHSTAAAYRALGHPSQNVLAVGHPHFDQLRQEAAHLSGVGRTPMRERLFPRARNRPVIAFLAEISGGLNPEQYLRSADYTLMGRGGSTRRTDIVLEEVLDAIKLISPRPYVVLRLHPKNAPGEFAMYESEVDFVSRDEPAHEIVFASDLVVGMTSHLLLEAAILDCRTLAVLPRSSEKNWLAGIGAGITPCVTTRVSLRATLAAMCELDSWNGTATKAEEVFVYGAVGRTVDILASLLARETNSQLHVQDR